MATLNREVQALLKAAKAAAKVALPADEDALRNLFNIEWRTIQAESLASKYRFNVEVWHRRAGKSFSKIFKLIRAALACPFPEGRYAYLGPTQEQVKDIAWHYIQGFAKKLPGCELKETAKELWVPSLIGDRSRIKLYGVDNPRQALRGLYLDGGVADEWQDIPKTVFTEQVRPMLMDENRRGTDLLGYPSQFFDFIGTPKGRNQLYEFHQRAEAWYKGLPVMIVGEDNVKREVFSDEWRAALYKASETGILSQAELDNARADMGQKYEQEMECDFDAMITGSVYGRILREAQDAGRITLIPINPLRPVHTAWDLGGNDKTAIWFFQEIGEAVLIVGYEEYTYTEFVEIVNDMRVMCDEGRRFRFGYHILPHDVAVFELGKGVRKKQLEDLGVTPIVVAPKMEREEGISHATALLKTCYFDGSRCMRGLDALRFYHRDRNERLGVLRDEPVHDWSSDAADAFRILATGRRKHRAGEFGGSSTSNRQFTAELHA